MSFREKVQRGLVPSNQLKALRAKTDFVKKQRFGHDFNTKTLSEFLKQKTLVRRGTLLFPPLSSKHHPFSLLSLHDPAFFSNLVSFSNIQRPPPHSRVPRCPLRPASPDGCGPHLPAEPWRLPHQGPGSDVAGRTALASPLTSLPRRSRAKPKNGTSRRGSWLRPPPSGLSAARTPSAFGFWGGPAEMALLAPAGANPHLSALQRQNAALTGCSNRGASRARALRCRGQRRELRRASGRGKDARGGNGAGRSAGCGAGRKLQRLASSPAPWALRRRGARGPRRGGRAP
ncbi:PREDICTED: uncharacterized protein LOC106149364, partial [Chinchilla lanigera]|uniref:uncharacterized protein LOC106149364 n=1 Tax=Chinchilla lanigera TaxID=34839 RepID=UPI0006968CC0